MRLSLPRMIRQFWTRSIHRQLIIGIVLVHAVLMTIFVVDLVLRQQDFLHERTRGEALSLAKTLAANSASWVLANDTAGLEEIIHSQSSYPGLRYAMVLSLEGRVLGHTDTSLTGLYADDSISKHLLQATASLTTLVDTSRLIDIAVPVTANGKPIGWARVGLDQEQNAAGLRAVAMDGVLYTVLAIAIGSLFAWFMANGLTGGLRRLVEVAGQVRSGNRETRATLQRSDELGQLARDFNAMLDVLLDNERRVQEAQSRLAASEERFELAMQGANDGLWDVDMRTKQVYFSSRWKEMLGYAEDELANSREEWESRIHPDDQGKLLNDLDLHLKGKTSLFQNLHRIRHRDGSYRWHLVRGVAVRDDHDQPYRMVGTSTDTTEREQARDALFEEKERALVTLHSIGDAVITTDNNSRVTYLNPVAESLTGWTNKEAQDKGLSEVFRIFNEQTAEPVESPVSRCLLLGHVVGLPGNTLLVNRSGDEIPIDDSAAPIRDRGGRVIGAVLVFHDVSRAREMRQAMNWQATHDSLTGLINRHEFERQLESLLKNDSTRNGEHAFLYLDLDQFKVVNDTSGHEAGDELLRQLASLIGKVIRDSDTFARLGGDEFGILLESCPPNKALEIAEKVHKTIRDFRFTWEKRVFEIGASIGVVGIDQHSQSLASILTAADVACYAAKDHGRNRIHLYQADDVELARRHGEMQWVTRIQEALQHERFVLFKQAITPIAPGKPERHMEVLLRLRDETGEYVPPALFIPAAERYNLMTSIDRWVVRNTMAWLAKNPGAADMVSINLSGSSMSEDEFLTFVKELTREYAVNPRQICFEITETAAIANLVAAIHFIRELKALGYYFALDDFGSGLSSFAYLKNLPVDFLKIDGSFVKDMADDPMDRAMVEAVNTVGHVMGLRTIAEFVENDAILTALRTIGVDYAQGYGIERPCPLEGHLATPAPAVKSAS